MSRFVRPESTRIDLTDGDWLIVKKRLSAGEQRAMFDLMVRPIDLPTDGRAPDIHVAPLEAGMGQVLAYLLDWSFVDDDGQPVVIRGASVDVVRSALDNLDPSSFTEVLRAIQGHERAMIAERAKKNGTSPGAPALPSTSPSPAVADGDTNGSLI